MLKGLDSLSFSHSFTSVTLRIYKECCKSALETERKTRRELSFSISLILLFQPRTFFFYPSPPLNLGLSRDSFLFPSLHFLLKLLSSFLADFACISAVSGGTSFGGRRNISQLSSPFVSYSIWAFPLLPLPPLLVPFPPIPLLLLLPHSSL